MFPFDQYSAKNYFDQQIDKSISIEFQIRSENFYLPSYVDVIFMK